jgi:adenine phosphoribosyltransferase
MDAHTQQELKDAIRTIPDYPKPGVMFRDITTLLGNARAFRRVVDELVQPWTGTKVDRVAGIEARGFILGGAIAHQLAAGFVPIRKRGKLPHTTVRLAYSLEYGGDEIEIHQDGVARGEKIVLVDDLIATGGTATAAVRLLRSLGADVLAACFIIDLPATRGARGAGAHFGSLSGPLIRRVMQQRARLATLRCGHPESGRWQSSHNSHALRAALSGGRPEALISSTAQFFLTVEPIDVQEACPSCQPAAARRGPRNGRRHRRSFIGHLGVRPGQVPQVQASQQEAQDRQEQQRLQRGA